jgi:hypothetical protein
VLPKTWRAVDRVLAAGVHRDAQHRGLSPRFSRAGLGQVDLQLAKRLYVVVRNRKIRMTMRMSISGSG